MPLFTASSETFLAWPVRSGPRNRHSFQHAGEYTDLALDDSKRCDLN